ncbi:tetra-peptide repeat homeobox protein 1-like [Hypomesus transpacificus]|uniref:tetra-peptide repeat homeobox protein 1-like n=1 Tax=Hypomesus transpacificus TaxID=137520 RepID=UPI001F07EFB1|nr:tetra-peptide repeat homeobox protein 1-like [Hypomesus transpacificus]
MACLLGDSLFEIDGQGPAPTKDYYQFTVTKTEVIWRSWKISLRSEFRNARPGELRMPHKDFLEDSRLQGQVRVVYGQKTLRYSQALCRGEFDFLERMPNALLLCILSHLELEDIARLRLTSRRLRQVCDSEEFWVQAVWSSCGPPSPQVCSLARELGWRQVFFTSKLQLQKLLSRRRRGSPRSPTQPHAADTVSLALSDMGLGSGPDSGSDSGPSPDSGSGPSPGPSPDSGSGPSPDSGSGPSPGPSPDSGSGPSPTPGPSPDSGSGRGPTPNLETQVWLYVVDQGGQVGDADPNPSHNPSPNPRPSPGLYPRPSPGLDPRPSPGLYPRPSPGPDPRPSPGPDLPGEQLAGLRKGSGVQRDPGNGRGDWKRDSGRRLK